MPRRAALVAFLASLLLAPRKVLAGGAPAGFAPLRVHVICQSSGRTKACPAFLRGFIDDTPVLAFAPLAEAQVVVTVNTTFVASDDLVDLRFTGQVPGAPAVYEVTQTVGARASDDEQRAQLRPAFQRGIAVFLGQLVPDAVQVALVMPAGKTAASRTTSPWGYDVYGGGAFNVGSQFQNVNVHGGGSLARTTASSRSYLWLGGWYWRSRQPSLVVGGSEVAIEADGYGVAARFLAERNLTSRWSIGSVLRGATEDPGGHYLATARAHAGVSRDFFAADDPRGNSLSVTYIAGGEADRYNRENVLGEERTIFLSHGLIAAGEVRVDRATYRLRGGAAAQATTPRRRYVLDASAGASLQLGARVDLDLEVSITKQAVPGAKVTDAGDYESVSRSSYAEPLRLTGFVNLRLHWDATNGARNDRWDAAGLDPVGSL